MPYTLGVDLGTTWTAGATLGADGVEAVPAGEDGPAVPSVVARDGERIVVGNAAERRLAVDPASGVREPKRRLGDETPFVLSGVPYDAAALLGHLLAHVVARATEARGEPPDAVVLTHPATWGEYKLDLLREAARVAGVPEDQVSLVSEPQAAAWHYSTLGRMGVGEAVAVYDFGGGTFDAAVVRRTEDGFEVVGQPKGLERLGGVDLDQAVFAHVMSALGASVQELDGNDPAVRQGLLSLRAACTSAKEALSADSEAAVPVALPGLSTQVRITRAEFEAMVRPRLAETLVALRAAVAAAGLEPDALSSVLLIGGSSRIPVVAEVVAREIGLPAGLDVDPKLAVAMGGAAYGRAEPVVEEPDTEEEPDAAPKSVSTTASAPSRSSPAQGRAAKIAVGGAVAAGVIAGGAAAAGAWGGGEGSPPPPGEPPPPADAPPGGEPVVDPAAAAAQVEDDASLDAFDDVAGPAPARGGGGGFGGFGGDAAPRRAPSRAREWTTGNGDGAERMERSPRPSTETGTAMGSMATGTETAPPPPPGGSAPSPGAPPPQPRTAPAPGTAPAGTAPPGSPEAQLEAIRDQARAWVASFKGPDKADAADVQAVKADLEGLIDRFQPLPGQSIEDAYGALKHEIDQTVKVFVTSENIEIEQEARAAQRAELDKDRGVWDTYKNALDTYVDSFVPSAPEHWWSPEDLGELKKQVKEMVDRRPYVPQEGKTMRAAQEDLERTVDTALDQFRREQYNKWLQGAVNDYRQTGSGLKPEILKDLVDAKLKDPLVMPAAEAALDAASAPALSSADITGKPMSERIGDVFRQPGKIFAPPAAATLAAAGTAASDPFDELMGTSAAAAARPSAGAASPSTAAAGSPAAEEDVLGSERLIAEVEGAPTAGGATPAPPMAPVGATPAPSPTSPTDPTAMPMTEPPGWRPSPGIVAGDLTLGELDSADEPSSFERPDDDAAAPTRSSSLPDDDDLGLP